MLTQLNVYFKFSNVKSQSHLFSHLTHRVKAGLSRVGATTMSSNARNSNERKFPNRAGRLVSLYVSSQHRSSREKNWAVWNKTSPGSVSSLKITVSRVIYMSTLREGKHSLILGSRKDPLLFRLCLYCQQFRRIRGVTREL